MSPTLRSAAGSDVGRRRAMNQDSAATTRRLLAVADGMGGHAHGEVASSVAIDALLELDQRLPDDLGQVDLSDALGQAVVEAADRLTELAKADPELRGTGTTVVAFLVDGDRIGIAHVGDSRAYLLRDGELFRLTRDHTLVQALLDEGRITPEEAAGHPRRSWLVRTLQEATPVEPDLFTVDGRAGDRYLICSDGATAVLDDEALRDVLDEVEDRAAAVQRLIELANEGGGPDNITCVVADLLDAGADGEDAGPGENPPVVVGAAAARD
jgi:serine/threonine protein phosphatase PrpC